MEISKKLKENNDFLENLEVSNSERIKSTIFGYLISLIIMGVPLIICSHFFIYSVYFNLVLGLLMFLILIFIILVELLSDQLLIHYSKTEEKKDLKVTYIIHSLLYSGMLLLGYLIILLLY